MTQRSVVNVNLRKLRANVANRVNVVLVPTIDFLCKMKIGVVSPICFLFFRSIRMNEGVVLQLRLRQVAIILEWRQQCRFAFEGLVTQTFQRKGKSSAVLEFSNDRRLRHQRLEGTISIMRKITHATVLTLSLPETKASAKEASCRKVSEKVSLILLSVLVVVFFRAVRWLWEKATRCCIGREAASSENAGNRNRIVRHRTQMDLI